jgi:hypothetical protein
MKILFHERKRYRLYDAEASVIGGSPPYLFENRITYYSFKKEIRPLLALKPI